MKTTIGKSGDWTLSYMQRYARAVIGTAAILGIIEVSSLGEVTSFVLMLIGFYTLLTAVLNCDIVYALFAGRAYQIEAPQVESSPGVVDATEAVATQDSMKSARKKVA